MILILMGLTLDEHMTWKAHTHKIANKISRALGIINSLKNVLPRNILLTLYNSLVLPHLHYSVLCWGFNPGRVSTLQKRAVRLISGSKYNAHSEPIFKKLELLSLKDIFNQSTLKFYFKLTNNRLPQYLHNMFQNDTYQHSHNTRNRQISTPIPVRVNGSKCIRYYLPLVLNSTPNIIKEKARTHSPKGFANYIKRYYLNSYTDICNINNCYICKS